MPTSPTDLDRKTASPDLPGFNGTDVDPATLDRVKEICLLFAHTISALKIFPDHHVTVLNFQDEFFDKLSAFLNDRQELEIAVEENAFLYENRVVYSDENIIKSLPFQFFKDGLQRLAFLRDLDKEEFLSFLKVLKSVSLLPADVSDIVDALWERDFAHILYSAPDSYLETRLAVHQKKIFDFTFDRVRLSDGRIDLTPEDAAEIYKNLSVLRRKEENDAVEFATLSAALDKGDLAQIEFMLGAERGSSAEDEFLGMIFELLYLEERFDQFRAVLAFLAKRLQDQVGKADFDHAALLFSQVEELGVVLAPKSPERASAVADFLRAAADQCPLDAIREMVRRGQIQDYRAFFSFLSRLGSKAASIGAELLEESREPEVRAAAFKYIETLGRRDLITLTDLAQDRRPSITKAIIAVFGDLNDKRAIPFLATFLTYKSRDIKVEAIKALGRFSDGLAHKILFGFLRDDNDPDIRTEAARQIRLEREPSLVAGVIRIAAGKSFSGRATAEKDAVLTGLARSGSVEALDFLKSFIESSSGLFAKAKAKETKLRAVGALESLATPEAVDILNLGAIRAGKKTRAACREAVERLTAPNRRTGGSEP